jgi:hypothetical protein
MEKLRPVGPGISNRFIDRLEQAKRILYTFKSGNFTVYIFSSKTDPSKYRIMTVGDNEGEGYYMSANIDSFVAISIAIGELTDIMNSR